MADNFILVSQLTKAWVEKDSFQTFSKLASPWVRYYNKSTPGLRLLQFSVVRFSKNSPNILQVQMLQVWFVWIFERPTKNAGAKDWGPLNVL